MFRLQWSYHERTMLRSSEVALASTTKRMSSIAPGLSAKRVVTLLLTWHRISLLAVILPLFDAMHLSALDGLQIDNGDAIEQ